MSGLFDIAPGGEAVEVRGINVDVCGISAEGVVDLIRRFPELQSLFAGMDTADVDLFALGPKIVSAVIAAGCGSPGDQAAENIARNLPIETQVKLLAAIKRQTLPGGIGPFVEALRDLGVSLPEPSDDSPETVVPEESQNAPLIN